MNDAATVKSEIDAPVSLAKAIAKPSASAAGTSVWIQAGASAIRSIVSR